ncbi:Arf GEF Syt22 [Schizosaccharomyces osmophilus]|uniref:Arf GEF Syt22 n=1 Tax=Schizosaccharomyces osmophilus TaxID=2545709 RepID=A0AAE9WDM6_9SCHI|nr:Arf GEF Syt22 [Schizosaccharomyces osmophilus]WBW74512.1 Arf GEF Syt22 [Schizosaccharomyces osmophilus]
MDLNSPPQNISSRNLYSRSSHRYQSSIASNASASSTSSKKSILKRLFPAHWFHKKEFIPPSSLESINEDNSATRSKEDTDSESNLSRSQSVLGFNSLLARRKTKKNSKSRKSPPYEVSTNVPDFQHAPLSEPVRPSTSLSFFEDVSFGPPFSADLILSSLPSSSQNSPLVKSSPASPYVNDSSVEANQYDFCERNDENYQTPNSSFNFNDYVSESQTSPITTKPWPGYKYIGANDENAHRFTPAGGALQDKTNTTLDESTRPLNLKNETSSHSVHASSLENRTCDPRLAATNIFNNTGKIVPNEDALSFLTQDDDYHKKVLEIYVSLYDFGNTAILQSLRIFCGNLFIKGETQKVDYLLEAFSSRWCQTNPKKAFCTKEIVHSVAFSLLLLNTDLHIANIASSQKMTRSQFVSNTLSDILQALEASFSTSEDKYQFLQSSFAFQTSNPNDGSAAISSLSDNLSKTKGGLTKNHEKKYSKLRDLETAFVNHWSLTLKEMYQSIKASSILQPYRYLHKKSNSQQQIADDIFAHAKNLSVSDNISLNSKKSESNDKSEDTITRPSSSLLFEYNNDGVLLFHNRFEKAMRHQFPDAKRSKSAMGYFQASCPSPDLPGVIIALKNHEHTPPFYLPPHSKYGILRYLIRYNGKLRKKDAWMTTLSILEKDILSLYSLEGDFDGDLHDLDISKIGNPILKTSIMGSVAHLMDLDKTSFRRPSTSFFYLETHSRKRLQFAVSRLGEAQGWIEALNYWAARTSRIPLLGSVSNVDYGWSLCTGNHISSGKDAKASSHKEGKYPKLSLKVWEPEPISGIPSELSIIKQYSSLKAFSKSLSEALKRHEAIHLEMLVILSSQNKNTFRRGVENWKARMGYLKSTMFKVKLYISVLKKYKKLAED